MHGLVDLVIPRGSKELVEYVQANTRIPVLGHAEGVCHIYVDESADEALALRVIEDAKVDYPAACNTVETVLVHRAIAAEFLPKLAEHLRARGVKLHGDSIVRELLRGVEVEAVEDWHTEYGELALSLGVVKGLDEAMEHIHAHGSAHTESILTEDAAVAERFLREVDAASVMHNASTRFADGFRYGFGAEVGHQHKQAACARAGWAGRVDDVQICAARNGAGRWGLQGKECAGVHPSYLQETGCGAMKGGADCWDRIDWGFGGFGTEGQWVSG